jgi:hypothetical protein
MSDLLEIFGGLLLVTSIGLFSYRLVVYVHRNVGVLVERKRITLLRCVLWATAGTLGITLASITWNLSSAESAVGFPLPWNTWFNSDPVWQGSMNPIAVIPWLADLALGLALGHLPAAILCFFKRRRLKISAGAT